MFAGEVGVPRLLKLFDKFKLKASWFIPGHSIETFPEQTRMIVTRGTRSARMAIRMRIRWR